MAEESKVAAVKHGSDVDWDARATAGTGFQAVIDPGDATGLKNALIDQIQWGRIGPWLTGRRAVLDFGCGVGRFAQRITARGPSYCGTDASLPMIDIARQLHRGSSAQFMHVAAMPLPFESGRFDGCLSVGVLQCLQTADGAQLREALAELSRVLAPGGQLLMIEQASASGQTSGSVAESATEQDYLDALAVGFEVKDLQRLRLGALSRPSSLFVRRGSRLPLRGSLQALLARHEVGRAASADAERLRQSVYYDVAIVATRRASAG